MLFAMATDAKKVIVMAGALVKIKYKLSYININLEQNMNMNMNLSSHVVGKTRSLVTHVPSGIVRNQTDYGFTYTLLSYSIVLLPWEITTGCFECHDERPSVINIYINLNKIRSKLA